MPVVVVRFASSRCSLVVVVMVLTCFGSSRRGGRLGDTRGAVPVVTVGLASSCCGLVVVVMVVVLPCCGSSRSSRRLGDTRGAVPVVTVRLASGSFNLRCLTGGGDGNRRCC